MSQLQRPSDYSKAILAGVVGLGVIGFSYTVTRSTIPHVGDNLHHLPHGGSYRDGTKAICYSGPKVDTATQPSGRFVVFLICVLLVGLIYGLSNSRNSTHLHRCSTVHCIPQSSEQPGVPSGSDGREGHFAEL
ncbi:MAG: triple gene block protein 2 [Physalis virus X]|nr:MAG: triple gene block protein 2 [Physalis virus X]UEP18567.1 MAG: triple gene block protein 2 [Physalis virus X]